MDEEKPCNEYERMLETALAQIESLTHGSREYLKWYGDRGPEHRKALERLRLNTLRESAMLLSLPAAAFAGLMALTVATHFYIRALWTVRDELKGPASFPVPPSIN
jgi:hypothetical protein